MLQSERGNLKMKKMLIQGGNLLSGEVTIGGAKNSTVAIIPAAILAESKVVLDCVPHIKDVNSLLSILEDMSVSSTFADDTVEIDPTHIISTPLPSGKIQSLRASYYFMGALLGRFGEAIVGLPGGDDLHVSGYQ